MSLFWKQPSQSQSRTHTSSISSSTSSSTTNKSNSFTSQLRPTSTSISTTPSSLQSKFQQESKLSSTRYSSPQPLFPLHSKQQSTLSSIGLSTSSSKSPTKQLTSLKPTQSSAYLNSLSHSNQANIPKSQFNQSNSSRHVKSEEDWFNDRLNLTNRRSDSQSQQHQLLFPSQQQLLPQQSNLTLETYSTRFSHRPINSPDSFKVKSSIESLESTNHSPPTTTNFFIKKQTLLSTEDLFKPLSLSHSSSRQTFKSDHAFQQQQSYEERLSSKFEPQSSQQSKHSINRKVSPFPHSYPQNINEQQSQFQQQSQKSIYSLNLDQQKQSSSLSSTQFNTLRAPINSQILSNRSEKSKEPIQKAESLSHNIFENKKAEFNMVSTSPATPAPLLSLEAFGQRYSERYSFSNGNDQTFDNEERRSLKVLSHQRSDDSRMRSNHSPIQFKSLQSQQSQQQLPNSRMKDEFKAILKQSFQKPENMNQTNSIWQTNKVSSLHNPEKESQQMQIPSQDFNLKFPQAINKSSSHNIHSKELLSNRTISQNSETSNEAAAAITSAVNNDDFEQLTDGGAIKLEDLSSQMCFERETAEKQSKQALCSQQQQQQLKEQQSYELQSQREGDLLDEKQEHHQISVMKSMDIFERIIESFEQIQTERGLMQQEISAVQSAPFNQTEFNSFDKSDIIFAEQDSFHVNNNRFHPCYGGGSFGDHPSRGGSQGIPATFTVQDQQIEQLQSEQFTKHELQQQMQVQHQQEQQLQASIEKEDEKEVGLEELLLQHQNNALKIDESYEENSQTIASFIYHDKINTSLMQSFNQEDNSCNIFGHDEHQRLKGRDNYGFDDNKDGLDSFTESTIVLTPIRKKDMSESLERTVLSERQEGLRVNRMMNRIFKVIDDSRFRLLREAFESMLIVSYGHEEQFRMSSNNCGGIINGAGRKFYTRNHCSTILEQQNETCSEFVSAVIDLQSSLFESKTLFGSQQLAKFATQNLVYSHLASSHNSSDEAKEEQVADGLVQDDDGNFSRGNQKKLSLLEFISKVAIYKAFSLWKQGRIHESGIQQENKCQTLMQKRTQLLERIIIAKEQRDRIECLSFYFSQWGVLKQRIVDSSEVISRNQSLICSITSNQVDGAANALLLQGFQVDQLTQNNQVFQENSVQNSFAVSHVLSSSGNINKQTASWEIMRKKGICLFSKMLFRNLKSIYIDSLRETWKTIELHSLQQKKKQRLAISLILRSGLLLKNSRRNQQMDFFKKLKQLKTQQSLNKKQYNFALGNVLRQLVEMRQRFVFKMLKDHVTNLKVRSLLVKNGIKTVSLLVSILSSKAISMKLSAFKNIQIKAIDVAHNHNRQNPSAYSLFKGFRRLESIYRINSLRSSFEKINETIVWKERMQKGLENVIKVDASLQSRVIAFHFMKLKSIVYEKLLLRKKIQSQKQIFSILLRTFFSKKIHSLQAAAFSAIKSKAHFVTKLKREKKLVYTESSMLFMKHKLLCGLLNKLYKKHCLQYAFQRIYGCPAQQQNAAIQFYQQLAAAAGMGKQIISKKQISKSNHTNSQQSMDSNNSSSKLTQQIEQQQHNLNNQQSFQNMVVTKQLSNNSGNSYEDYGSNPQRYALVNSKSLSEIFTKRKPNKSLSTTQSQVILAQKYDSLSSNNNDCEDGSDDHVAYSSQTKCITFGGEVPESTYLSYNNQSQMLYDSGEVFRRQYQSNHFVNDTEQIGEEFEGADDYGDSDINNNNNNHYLYSEKSTPSHQQVQKNNQQNKQHHHHHHHRTHSAGSNLNTLNVGPVGNHLLFPYQDSATTTTTTTTTTHHLSANFLLNKQPKNILLQSPNNL